MIASCTPAILRKKKAAAAVSFKMEKTTIIVKPSLAFTNRCPL